MSLSPDTLDAAARRLAERVLAAWPPERPYGRAELGPLPAAVARVLTVGLDHTASALAREVAAPETPWLDAESPALRAAVDAWAEAAREAVRYPAEAWPEAVAAASHVALRLLVSPADALAAVAFDGVAVRDERPAADVVARLAAATPYAYLADVAARYVERKELEAFDRAATERLLARIDRRMADTLAADDWLALAEPLFETAGPDGTPAGTLPAPLVQSFFEARGHGALLASMTNEPVSRAALRATLAAWEPSPAADASPPPVAEPSPSAPDAPTDEVAADTPPAVEEVASPDAPALPLDDAPSDGTALIGDAPTEAEPPADEPEPAVAPMLVAPMLDAPVPDEPMPDAPVPDEPVPDEPVPDESVPDESGDEWLSTPVAADASVEDAPADEPHAGSPAPGTPLAPPAPSPALPVDDPDEPLWRRLARQHDAAASPDPDASASDEPPPLWQRFSAGASPAPEDAPSDTLAARFLEPPPLASARSERPGAGALAPPDADSPMAAEARVLGPGAGERRSWFVTELFQGDREAYHETIRELDHVATWTEATQIIARDVFRRYGVQIYSDPAVAFTDAVEAQMARRQAGA